MFYPWDMYKVDPLYGRDARVTAGEIDKVIDHAIRSEKYQLERDQKHGVATVADVPDVGDSSASVGETRILFWEALRDFDRETALYLVLTACMGYSKAEVAVGLGVSYSRVKYLTQKACKQYQAKQ